MSPPIDIDGSEIQKATIDGQNVNQVTIDGQEVFVDVPIPDSGIARYEWEQDATDSWNDNDLTLNGGTFTADSAVGSYAVSLDGVDDEASGTLSAGSGNVSVACWIDNLSSASNRDYICGIANEFWIGVNADGEFFARMINTDNNLGTSTSVVRGQGWTHVAVTIEDGNTVTTYVNGNQDDSFPTTQSIDFGSQTFRVGNRGNIFSDRDFEGGVDDVRLYDKELTATEVSNLESTGSI